MGYRYRSNWRAGTDIIVMTKRGLEESGIPKGVIIPTHQNEAYEYIENTEHNVYVTKHCDSFCTATHIVPFGVVNVFGWFVTKEEIPGDDWSFEIGSGWFKCVTVDDVEQIEKYL